MPEQPDGGLVPPVKVLRKRLNGVYRADGFSGPTRRYVLVVSLLVGLASLPTLAAITAGTNELDRGTTGAMDVPFLPPPSSGPIVPAPAPSPGVVHGRAGTRRTPSHRNGRSDVPGSAATGGTGRRSAPPSGSRAKEASGASGSRRGSSGSREEASRSRGDAFGSRGDASGSRGDASGSRGYGHPSAPSRDGAAGRPSGSGHSAPPTADPHGVPVPPGHPEPPRHRQCENATLRARWSHHRGGHPRGVTVAIVPTGRHGEHPADSRFQHTRRSTVTERPSNAYPPHWEDRTQNSRSHRAEWRWYAGHAAGRAYRGVHRADDASHDRSSRVGRHHAPHLYRW